MSAVTRLTDLEHLDLDVLRGTSLVLEAATGRTLADGRKAALRLQLFNTRLVVHTPDDMYFEDGWCYQTFHEAAAALARWSDEEEPDGWIKHPGTGRRRISITCATCDRVVGHLEYR